MKTDSLLYRLFNTAPAILFDLLGQSPQEGYEFRSLEVKQTAHRIDGVFLPPNDRPDLPIYFAEFQFQNDRYIYHRLFAEIFLYLEQYPEVADWQAVVIFPRRSLEPEKTSLHRSLLNSDQVQRFYLNELQDSEDLPLSLELLRLVVASPKKAPQLAKRIVATSFSSPNLSAEEIIDLVIISMVYKFPNFTREAIMQMLELATEVRQTRFYQDVLEEGKQVGLQEGLQVGLQEGLQVGLQEGRQVGLQEGRQVGLQEGLQEGRTEEGRSFVLRLLNRRVGTIAPELKVKIEALTIVQLEDLGEALLDFATIADLEAWLAQVQIRQGISC